MRGKKRSKHAVSEVIGVVLLLGITITLFAILNTFVFRFSFDPSVPSVNLIGTVDKANNIINIEHNGGESLEGNINVTIEVGSLVYHNTSGELLVDTNSDNKWNFGETVRFYSPVTLANEYIRVTAVDPTTNTIILSVVLP